MSFISYIDIQDNTHYVNINDIICIGQKCGDLILITKHFTANIPMHADNDIYYDIVKKITYPSSRAASAGAEPVLQNVHSFLGR